MIETKYKKKRVLVCSSSLLYVEADYLKHSSLILLNLNSPKDEEAIQINQYSDLKPDL